MAHFISHDCCKKCGSSDARAEYSDGSYYCFSCGKFTPAPASLQSVTNHFAKNVTKVTTELQSLPYDVTDEIRGEALAWLNQYQLTNEELFRNNILWSASSQMLIMPYFADGNLLCWQGRYFPTRKQKVTTEGKPESHLLLHSSNKSDSRVCVVEDTISGIKVARQMDSCVLWGSNLSNQKARLLSKYYDHLVLWLDGDKTREMIKFQTRYGWMFKSCKIISTDKDPKEHTTEEITSLLT